LWSVYSIDRRYRLLAGGSTESDR